MIKFIRSQTIEGLRIHVRQLDPDSIEARAIRNEIKRRLNLTNRVPVGPFIEWRKSMGLTQDAAAKALGASRRAVQLWERNGTVPRYIALAAAAVTLQVPPIGHQPEATSQPPQPE
jgi:DNA-binding XRE family transcriptional regulator